ncbi:MAG TPA: YebC/PmpR family DNA-binding transcriptional regulator [Clostridia bacterium]|nr:YebC/PmpR family DNA-binding transcriptional regulator [Clostridia bacterium]
MSGHSKWANIKHKKAKVDAQRGNIFSKITREIIVSVRKGGPNPEANARLRAAIQRARENNIPMDNINRAIARVTKGQDDTNYEELVYEGYGPGGVAIMLEALSDNRNRTASDVRYIFSKHGGSLGEAGCVSWLFSKKGYILIDRSKVKMDEDELMGLAIEAGAVDFSREGDSYEILTEPEDLEEVKGFLESKGIPLSMSEVTMVPQSTVSITGHEAEQTLKLMDALEEHEDVQKVYANFDIPEEEMQKRAQ